MKTAVGNQLPFSLQGEFGSLIDEFSDVFSKNEWDIGKCDVTSHTIDVCPGSRPVNLPNRRMPLHYKEDLREKLDAFLEKGLVIPCHSPYSAPAIMVPKKNGKLRLAIDYRQLNNQIIKLCRPIPSIEEIFDTLEGSAYFTTINMSWGFYQLPMVIKSQDLTAFSTPFGSFKWLRMPMGLTGSPNTFQSLMECVLMGLTWKITVPYLDDCIIFSKTPWTSATSVWKVSLGKPQNQSNQVRIFPDTSALPRTHNQQKWAGSRPGKAGRCEELSNSYKPNRSQIYPGPLLVLPSLCEKLRWYSPTTAQG